jgi:hypothetical protein
MIILTHKPANVELMLKKVLVKTSCPKEWVRLHLKLMNKTLDIILNIKIVRIQRNNTFITATLENIFTSA